MVECRSKSTDSGLPVLEPQLHPGLGRWLRQVLADFALRSSAVEAGLLQGFNELVFVNN